MYKLSIMIPTYNREKQFKSLLHNCIYRILKEYTNIECVIACSTKEYLPDINHDRIKVFNTESYTREENYIFGIGHCTGKHVLIAEDDDIIVLEGIRDFMNNETDLKLFIYDGYLPNSFNNTILNIEKDNIYKSSLDLLFLICNNKFQWGQCITEKSLLLKNMILFWKKYKNIVRSDEIITMLCLKEIDKVYISKKILLMTRVFNDNYSWNNTLEIKQDNLYKLILKEYFNL